MTVHHAEVKDKKSHPQSHSHPEAVLQAGCWWLMVAGCYRIRVVWPRV